MFQLKFSDEFTSIIRDISYWKKEEDIPKEICSFFKKHSKIQAIYDNNTKKLYCSHCSNILDENYYCDKCHLQYQNNFKNNMEAYKEEMEYYYNNSDIIWAENIEKMTPWQMRDFYYVFDVVEHQVFLYQVTIYTDCHYSLYTKTIFQNQEYEIEKAFFVEQNGFIDLMENKYYDFLECDKKIYQDDYNEGSDKIFNFYYSNEFPLYVENLETLKNTIYQYSFIWKAKEYLKQKEMTVMQLLFLPLYFPQFEYLIKQKLFSLAFESPNLFQKGNSFQQIFGVDKKYLPFMVKNNITSMELEILKSCPTEDIDTIRFFFDFPFYRMSLEQFVHDTQINLLQLKDYFQKNKLTSTYLNEYVDYILMAKQLGYDIKDKKVKYPNNIIEEHDKLYLQMEMIKDPEINQKIKNLSTFLSFNYYEDDQYMIIPTTSIESLIKESEQQYNCVRTYSTRLSNNECQIYFMRKKEDKDTSFITIEVQNKKIIQARTKYNGLPEKEASQILKKWEKTLIPIVNIEEP